MAVLMFLLLVAVGGGSVGTMAATQMEEKCGGDFTKLAVCIGYATGKAETPTKDCCTTVQGIKDSEPECLCFIMKATHSGNDKIKSMGIQETKLLQLPSACSLKNASLAECPKLLGLAPNSTEAAIFSSNATTAPSSSTTTSGGSGTAQTTGSSSLSDGSVILPQLVALLAMAMTIVSLALIS
ncbi:hypothetical protein UlMin_040017 [Ulmus minor]